MPMWSRRWWRVFLVSCVAAVLLAGCGGQSSSRVHAPESASASPSKSSASGFADLPTAEILRQGLAALQSAETLRVRLTAGRTKPLALDFRRATTGDCIGSHSVGGVRATEILTGKYVYVRGSARYWRNANLAGASEVMQRTPGQWAQFGANEFSLGVCRATNLFKTLQIRPKHLRGLQASTPYPSTDSRTVVSLTNSDSTIKLEVEVDEPHHLIRVDAFGAVTLFSDFGAPVSIKLPGQFVPFLDPTI
jgi:hypothetical protein